MVWSRAEEPEFKQLGRFLTLKNVTHDQAGVYTCTVTNVVRYSDYSCLLKYVTSTSVQAGRPLASALAALLSVSRFGTHLVRRLLNLRRRLGLRASPWN